MALTLIDIAEGDQHTLQHARSAGKSHLVQQLYASRRTVSMKRDRPHQRLQVGCLVPGIDQLQPEQVLRIVGAMFEQTRVITGVDSPVAMAHVSQRALHLAIGHRTGVADRLVDQQIVATGAEYSRLKRPRPGSTINDSPQ